MRKTKCNCVLPLSIASNRSMPPLSLDLLLLVRFSVIRKVIVEKIWVKMQEQSSAFFTTHGPGVQTERRRVERRLLLIDCTWSIVSHK